MPTTLAPAHGQLRAQLAADLDRYRRQLAQLTGETDRDGHDTLDLSDAANLAAARDRAGSLAASTHARLADTLAAIGRIDDGTYGICVDCRDVIPAERLEVRPATDRCVTCVAGR